MNLEPPSLNLSLTRKNTLPAKVIACCALIAIIAAFVNPPFSLVFTACLIVAIPMILILTLDLGRFGQIGKVVITIGYLNFAKSTLIPFVIGLLEQVVTF